MTLPELLALATTTLNSVPHHPAVTPELCAAICWVESSGNPNAIGDKGAAYGLAQFHRATWTRFAKVGCPTHDMVRRDHQLHAFCRECAMRALVAELSHAAERAPTIKRVNLRRWLCRFHNAGRFDDANTVYCRRVQKTIAALAAPSEPRARASGRATTQPAGAAP